MSCHQRPSCTPKNFVAVIEPTCRQNNSVTKLRWVQLTACLGGYQPTTLQVDLCVFPQSIYYFVGFFLAN